MIQYFSYVHITDETLQLVQNKFQVKLELTEPRKTFLVIDSKTGEAKRSKRVKRDRLSVDSHSCREERKVHPRQKPKNGECWGTHIPFSNISENRIAKTIGLAVRLHFFLSEIIRFFYKTISMMEPRSKGFCR